MQQISTSTVAQCTAGLSPLIGPLVRLLVTSETKVKLNSQTQISLMRRCSKVKPRVCRRFQTYWGYFINVISLVLFYCTQNNKEGPGLIFHSTGYKTISASNNMPVWRYAPMVMGGNESHFPKIHIFEVRVSLRMSSKCRHDRVSAAHIASIRSKRQHKQISNISLWSQTCSSNDRSKPNSLGFLFVFWISMHVLSTLHIHCFH